MSTLSLCQCDVHNSNTCDNSLFLNERLSDLTITFPSHNVSFPAHRLLMAKKSLYFENLLYGPMAIKDQEWKINASDVEPEVFKMVLAYCYDLNLLEENLEIILQVYKLADCYMIDSLKSICLKHVQDIISKDSKGSKWDYQCILEWSKEYGFTDIVTAIFEGLSDKLKCDLSLLLSLPLETCKELLSRNKYINANVISFKKSWRKPETPLSSELLMSYLQSASFGNEIQVLKGCFSPQVVETIVIEQSLYISLIDSLHSQALYEFIKDLDTHYLDKFGVSLHIPCNSMSPNDLEIWSSEAFCIYLSNVDDQHVHWAIATIISIKPNGVFLPISSLTVNGFETLYKSLVPTEDKLVSIDICSSNIKVEYEEELHEWLNQNYENCRINIYKSDDDILGW